MFNPEIHHRRSIRLKDYDYAQPGAYFVTICVYRRECLLGEIIEGEIRSNEFGEIVKNVWNDLPNHYQHVVLGEFCVMPNHIHGIIVLTDIDSGRGGSQTHPYNIQISKKRHALPEIVRSLKSFSSRIRCMSTDPTMPRQPTNPTRFIFLPLTSIAI